MTPPADTNPSDPTSSQHPWRWLLTGDAAFAAMLTAISQATQSVDFETYIFTNSEPGRNFRDALVQAAQRAVRVRILLDSFGSMTLSEAFWAPLREAGGDLRWFNPLTLRHWNIRDHRKLLICDGHRAFVGGFNVSEEFVGDGVQRGWRDLGLQFDDPSIAAALALSFNQMRELADFRHRHPQRLRRRRGVRIDVVPNALVLAAGPGRGRHPIRNTLLADLRSATDIRIIAAYFLPPGRFLRAIQRAAHRGGLVQIILPAQSDVALLLSATRGLYGRLLRAKVRIYEYQPQILHTKFIQMDDRVYVGSANLDRRSLGINYELLVRLDHPQLAAEGRAVFDEHLRHSLPIDHPTWKKSRTPWQRTLEWLASTLFARLDPYLTRPGRRGQQ